MDLNTVKTLRKSKQSYIYSPLANDSVISFGEKLEYLLNYSKFAPSQWDKNEAFMFVGIREVEIYFLTNIGLLPHARAPRWNKREQHATGSFWRVESISGVFGVLGYKCPILLGERTRHV